MELEGETETESEPFADLAARLDDRGADPDAAWDAFAERVEREAEEEGKDAPPSVDGATPVAAAAATESEVAPTETLAGAEPVAPDADAGVAPPTIDAEPLEPEAAAALDELIDEEDERLAGEAVKRVAEERTYVVPKSDFCETCEHFSAPPEMACGNEGTELVEFEDMEHVRVRDCPVVEERKAFDDVR